MAKRPKNAPASFEEDLHELEVEYALTEPRQSGVLKKDHISEQLMASLQLSVHEIHAFIFRWENLPLEDYVRQHRDLQLDPFRMIVNGEVADISSGHVAAMTKDKTIDRLHQHFPRVGPGSPLISNIDVRAIDPETAVAVYHRTEYDLKGKAHESESALILVRRDNKWKVAVFTRRPLPDLGQPPKP